MRIAFIVDTFPSLSETFILNQITGLIDLGHEVEIFAGTRPYDRDFHGDIQKYDLKKYTYYHNDKPRNKVFRIFEAIWLLSFNFFKSPGVILRSLNIFRYGREALSLTYFYKVILFICMGRFDVIQCQFGPNGNLGALLKELGISGKLVTMFHGYDIRKGIAQGGGIYQKLFEQGDCFLSIADYNRKHLLAFGADPKKIIYHPVGINLERFLYKKKDIQFEGSVVKIITIARFVKEKGLHFGIQAIHRLVNEMGIKNIEYYLIGDGSLHQELRALVDQLKLEGYIKFIGAQNQEGVNQLLQESDIYFLPSVDEVLPVVLMEAQAVGLPVVATNVGSVAQLIIEGQSGFLVKAEDPQDMAEKLSVLIKDTACWESMGQKGRAFIEEHYDIQKLNKRLVEIYEGLL